jgi:hypothetical protein
VTPKVVHVGDLVTAKAMRTGGGDDVWVLGWELDDLPPAGDPSAGAQVKVVSGCAAKDWACTWKVTSAAAAGWVVVTVSWASNIGGPAESQDFYGVVRKGTHVLDGYVRDQQGTGMGGVTITIARNQVTYDAQTDGNGFYNALLPAHVWGVFPLAKGLQRPDEVTFSPGSRAIDLSTDKTASFTLHPCGKHGSCRPFFDWQMPDRYGLRNANGLVDYPSVTSDQASGNYQVAPTAWPVTFTIVPLPCQKDEQWAWRVTELSHAGKAPLVADTGAFTSVAGHSCEFTHAFPEEGIYKVTLTTARQVKPGEYAYAGEWTERVWVKDWLIVGLGDDFGSGAGSADVPGANPKWEYAACQRSADSFEAKVAEAVEAHDMQTSVTFLHIACAGAAVSTSAGAMIGGALPGGGSLSLSEQLVGMKGAIGARVPDAVVVSIGANDIGYWDIVTFCAEKAWTAYDPLQGEPVEPQFSKHCYDEPYPEGSTSDLASVVARDQAATLKEHYALLNDYLRSDGVPADRVYLVEYPDPTSGSDGTCRSMDFDGTVPGSALHSGFKMPGFDYPEALWLSTVVVHGINEQARIAAENYGWHYVGGIAKGFVGHGYCAPQDERWITTLEGSIDEERSMNGAMHPNLAGNEFIARVVSKAVLDDLYPGGQERSH